MEAILSTKLPPELVTIIMKMVHQNYLQEIHKLLKKVKFGFIYLEPPFDAKCYIYKKKSKYKAINGTVSGYRNNKNYYRQYFMHNYVYDSRF